MEGNGMANCVAERPLEELAVDLGGGVQLEMVLIPAGQFLMGSADSDKDARGAERPQHPVRITKPFYLGKYEVQQAQWEAVMGNNPSTFKGATNPVEQVSWDDCQQFLDKLTAKTAEQGGRFVLPTQAEWEYACRGGSTTRFSFGDAARSLGEYAWYKDNSEQKTHPVGKKKPNAWGLYDMHGNVWEWCHDLYDEKYYSNTATDDPQGPSLGVRRVLRGGSWRIPAGICRSAGCDSGVPGYRDTGLGFRVARVPLDK
jgi:formylglycine-generating enzyme required for sulfatase activity